MVHEKLFFFRIQTYSTLFVQVYVYNDSVVHGGVRPNLIQLFEHIGLQFEDKVSYYC